jgi:hypothetical protein
MIIIIYLSTNNIIDNRGGLVGSEELATQSAPSVTGSQSATTLTQAVADGSGFVFKFRDPLTSHVHRFTSKVIPTAAGESPLGCLLDTLIKKCQCQIVINHGDDPHMADLDDDDDDLTIYQGMPARQRKSKVNRFTRIADYYQRFHYIPARSSLPPHIISPLDVTGLVPPDMTLLFRVSYKDDEGDYIELRGDAVS